MCTSGQHSCRPGKAKPFPEGFFFVASTETSALLEQRYHLLGEGLKTLGIDIHKQVEAIGRALVDPLFHKVDDLLRRLRRERLLDLPPLHEREDARVMPAIQAAAYDAAITQARAGGRGDVLAALQRLRAVSLHPQPDAELEDDEFIAASARFVSSFAALYRPD